MTIRLHLLLTSNYWASLLMIDFCAKWGFKSKKCKTTYTAWFSPQPESDPTTNALIKEALYSRTLHLIGSRHEQTKQPEYTYSRLNHPLLRKDYETYMNQSHQQLTLNGKLSLIYYQTYLLSQRVLLYLRTELVFVFIYSLSFLFYV